jgi:hypothetical protein
LNQKKPSCGGQEGLVVKAAFNYWGGLLLLGC